MRRGSGFSFLTGRIWTVGRRKFVTTLWGENWGNTFPRGKMERSRSAYDQYDKFGEKFGPSVFTKRPSRTTSSAWKYRFNHRASSVAGGARAGALRNSGVMIHGEAPEGMDKDQDFPRLD